MKKFINFRHRLSVFCLLMVAIMSIAGGMPAHALTYKAIEDINNRKFWYDVNDKVGVCGTTSEAAGTDLSSSETKIAIAKIIMGIAKTDGLDQNGAIIGLMVGLDESGLTIYANSKVPLSLAAPNKQATGHDGTSLGVMQQQITKDWSTYSSKIDDQKAVTQLMDPAYNAEAFFGGAKGTPAALSKGLINHPGWEKLDPWVAAQQTQVSGTSDGSNYLKFYETAKGYVDKYWSEAPAIPLPFPIEGGVSGDSSSAIATACQSAADASLGVGKGKFTDNTSVVFPGVQDMLARAKEFAKPNSAFFNKWCPQSCKNRCEYDVGVVWGDNGGDATALTHWRRAVANGDGHPNDRNPPVGALLFYDGTSSSAGHVVVYLGNNKIMSNDVGDGASGRYGGIYIVDAADMETGTWRLHYVGWAEPNFLGSKINF